MEARKREFIELFNQSGWNQAEAARKLDLTRGGINGIITGDTVPSQVLLNYFRLLLGAEGKNTHGAWADTDRAEPWRANLIEELQQLPTKERDSLARLFGEIARLFPRPKISYRASSKVRAEAEAIVDAIEQEADRELRATDQTKATSPAPPRGVSGATKTKPSAQGPGASK